MRLHHLTIQAFGPFGGSVDIDFDELNAAGQFLISGATGAGKTSILDAVCFALYGEVPGERQRAKHLRSDHAEAGAEPRVTLTLTVADRLVRISRSPAWERPKRRGTGLTPQQASVRLEQELEGEWRCLATRLDEAGHLVNTWLGMTPVQFTQVALLPQGGFQTFLQSPTAARQAVLQRLFRTDRFERVERWFADFRRTLNRARTDALHQIDVVTHRLAEASGSDDAPAPDAGVDALVAWADARSLALDEAQAVAGADYEEAASRQARAARDLQEATALVTVLDRAADAQEQLADLAATASAFEDDLLALHAHDRATSLAPLIRSSAEAETIAARARRHALTALREAGLGGDESDDDLAEQAASAREAVQHAERTQALATKVAALRTDEAQADRATEAAAAALAELTAAGQSLPAQRLALVAELQSAIAAQGDLAACVVEVEVAEQGLDAARDLEIAAADLAEKVDLRRLQQDQVLELRQQYQDAREARIEAMAAELARGLVVGCSCPVCGSTAHPSPAASVTSVGRRAEDRARKKYETAGVALTALDEVIAAGRARAEALEQRAGGVSLVAWEQQVADLRARRDDLAARAGAIEPLQSQISAIDTRAEHLAMGISAQVQLEAQARAQLESAIRRREDAEAEVADALGDHLDAQEYLAQARLRADRVASAARAHRRSREADSEAAQCRAALDLQARSLGFAAGDDAEQALLNPERAEAIRRCEHERSQRRLGARAVLEDPLVLASLPLPRPDLEQLAREATQADHAFAAAQASLHLATTRQSRSRAVREELDAAVARYQPIETKAEQVQALSGLLEGTGADNRLRMRLSAFVLAERLRQVIDAANARLQVISEGRYVLSYQEERGAGEARGGLSLSVLDEWTGVRRDPSTLSGGETFVVSLCLALGLADTVADEAGGLRIDTLFIDEGFGSLDAQTLDSVIDILGQLSQGGRVTGVVSHVSELRERMPAVLEVVPSKSGSTVRRAAL